jgi:ankyrin repeat protein
MQWLISEGADVHARSTSLNQSTLSKAIVHGSLEVVDFLLSQEQDIESDLLHNAAQRQDQVEGATITTKLLELGAKVDTHHYESNNEALRFRWFSKRGTPLHTACSEWNIPVAKVLLRHDASPDAMMIGQDQEMSPTPIEIAERKGNAELCDMLVACSLQSKLRISVGNWGRYA